MDISEIIAELRDMRPAPELNAVQHQVLTDAFADPAVSKEDMRDIIAGITGDDDFADRLFEISGRISDALSAISDNEPSMSEKMSRQADDVIAYRDSPIPGSDLAGLEIKTADRTYYIEFNDGDLHVYMDGYSAAGDEPLVLISSRSRCGGRTFPQMYVANPDPDVYPWGDKHIVSLEDLQQDKRVEEGVWFVDSMSDERADQSYMVTRLSNGNWACSCKHWQHRLNGTGETCKHIDWVVHLLDDDDGWPE